MAALGYEPDEKTFTYLDCEQLENDTGFKFEWMNGQLYAKAGDEAMQAAILWMSARGFTTRVVAMAGVGFTHNRLAANLMRILGSQLRGKPCEPLGSDMKVRVQEADVNSYPDLIVACPPHQWDDQTPNALLNPSVIIEILSPSTQHYDRSGKWERYRRLASLRDFLLMSSDKMQIEHFGRQENGDWLLHIAEAPGDGVTLSSIGCRLSSQETYERVEFSSQHPTQIIEDAVGAAAADA